MFKAPTYAFITRVPKSCTHSPQEWHSLYKVTAPNRVPSIEDAVIRGEMEWRNIFRSKGTERDLTGNVDVDPDFYALTRCDRCDADKIKRWNAAHWEQSPWERQMRFAYWLAAQDFLTHTLSEIERQRVIHGVREFHLTKYDFKLLDEYPYKYVTTFDDIGVQEWHYKLRQVRNTHNNLFDVLNQNESDGYSDDNKVPPIPLMVFNDMD